MRDAGPGTTPASTLFPHGDRIVMRCARCGAEKPNDAAWARPCVECPKCGHTTFEAVVTFSETPEGVVAHGDVEYEMPS